MSAAALGISYPFSKYFVAAGSPRFRSARIAQRLGRTRGFQILDFEPIRRDEWCFRNIFFCATRPLFI